MGAVESNAANCRPGMLGECSQEACPYISLSQRPGTVSGEDDNVRRFVHSRGAVSQGGQRYLLCFRPRRHATAWTEKCHGECQAIWRIRMNGGGRSHAKSDVSRVFGVCVSLPASYVHAHRHYKQECRQFV